MKILSHQTYADGIIIRTDDVKLTLEQESSTYGGVDAVLSTKQNFHVIVDADGNDSSNGGFTVRSGSESIDSAAEKFKVAPDGDVTIYGDITFDTAAAINNIDELRINENGTGLRMTNVGAFDSNAGDFRIFSTSDLQLKAGSDTGLGLTIDGTTYDVSIDNDLNVGGSIGVTGQYTLPTTDGSASQVLTTNGSGTTSFASIQYPSFLVFGYETSISNQVTWVEGKTTNGSQNGQGWRMPVGGSVTHISCQFDCTTAGANFEVELYKNGAATGKTLAFTPAVGDAGSNAAITAESFNAGDRLTLFLRHSANGLHTGDHSFSLRILTTN